MFNGARAPEIQPAILTVRNMGVQRDRMRFIPHEYAS